MGVSEFLKDVANGIGKELRQQFSTTGSRGRGRSPARSGPRPPEARHGSGRGRSASPVHSSSQTSEQGSSAFLKYLRERGKGRGPWVKTEGGYALLDENGRTIDTRPSSGGEPPQSKSDHSRLPESFYHSYFPNAHPKAALCETCGERQVTSGGPPQELTDGTDGPPVFGLPYICDVRYSRKVHTPSPSAQPSRCLVDERASAVGMETEVSGAYGHEGYGIHSRLSIGLIQLCIYVYNQI
ncbi:hypothetical protein DB88DRAFT_32157 [Papiliotrema laurentii]|uniref:Uncharacterized protein n=1 Tax=Papiliotrema laurentii TaxID=5418 RepID=A0AAD9L8X6_PAPLA|nr:hypothetical protein DB88DRAFT_32157 [Papiliotrema laurentii]